MKTLFSAAAFALVLLFAGVAQSQDARFGLSIAGQGHFPVGDFGDAAGFGLGATGGIEVGAYPGVAITARSGYIQHNEKDDYTNSFIPILGGVKLTAPNSPVYLSGELGAVMRRQEYSGSNVFEDELEEDTNLGWTAGIGSMAGALDLRLYFNVWDAGSMSDAMTLGMSLGFTFFSW